MNQLNTLTVATPGYALRDAGVDHVSMGREEWLGTVRSYAHQVAAERGQVSINDVRDKFSLPPGTSPNLWGAVFRTRQFTLVGFDVANRPQSHARRIGVYKTLTN